MLKRFLTFCILILHNCCCVITLSNLPFVRFSAFYFFVVSTFVSLFANGLRTVFFVQQWTTLTGRIGIRYFSEVGFVSGDAYGSATLSHNTGRFQPLMVCYDGTDMRILRDKVRLFNSAIIFLSKALKI